MKRVDRETIIAVERDTRGAGKLMRIVSLVMIGFMANKYYEK